MIYYPGNPVVSNDTDLGYMLHNSSYQPEDMDSTKIEHHRNHPPGVPLKNP